MVACGPAKSTQEIDQHTQRVRDEACPWQRPRRGVGRGGGPHRAVCPAALEERGMREARNIRPGTSGRQAPAERGRQHEVVLTTGGKLLKEEREVWRAGATP